MKIIGWDFNAELGPCEGVTGLQALVITRLTDHNCRGEWLAQWLLEKGMVALNTTCRKPLQKQVTYKTLKGFEKQLDYIMRDRNHYSWSRDAEANYIIHMGSDHRYVWQSS